MIWIQTLVVGLLGLILGSFVNAFVWRLHEQAVLWSRQRKPTAKQLAAVSISRGRSMCPHCRHELGPADLVPLFSWLVLRGKCRYCRTPISWQYPVVELLTAGLFALSYAVWPLARQGVGLFQLIMWLGFLVMFMALAVYDLRWMLLPDKIVFPLIGVACLEVVSVAIWRQSWSQLWQPLVGAVSISGLFYVLFQVSAGTWIGGGDVKLAVVLGLLVATPVKAFLLLFLASLIGTLISLPLLIANGRSLKLKVPFGPFLLAATLITVLAGSRLIDWYTSYFV